MTVSEELSREEKRALRKAEKRKAKYGDDPQAAGESSGLNEATKTSSKKEKTLTKSLESIKLIPPDVAAAEVVKPKKRKHANDETPTTQEDSELPSPPSKKKKESAQNEPNAATSLVEDTQDEKAQRKLEKKAKKDAKRKLAEEQAASTSTSIPDSPSPEKKLKSTKSSKTKPLSTTFSNPSDDSELPESSSKSLIYAYQYAQSTTGSPDEWKFSKARQNWLVRHLWYDDAIPEEYVGLVIHYLKSVKGGGREEMIKGCKIILNPMPRTVSVAVPPPAPSSSTDGAQEETKGRKVKFVAEEETVPADDAAAVVLDPAEEKRLELRKARAKILLEALES